MHVINIIPILSATKTALIKTSKRFRKKLYLYTLSMYSFIFFHFFKVLENWNPSQINNNELKIPIVATLATSGLNVLLSRLVAKKIPFTEINIQCDIKT